MVYGQGFYYFSAGIAGSEIVYLVHLNCNFFVQRKIIYHVKMIIFIGNLKKMNQTFEITRTSRKIVSQFLENHTLEQLNKIPEGFKNNLIWNIAHIVVTQQLLVYKFSGLSMMVSDELVQKYMKGTKPEHIATEAEVDEIKFLLSKTIDQTKEDFDNTIYLKLRQCNFEVKLGSVSFLDKKINNLKAFYQKNLHDKTLNNYSKVNLQFDNQVVCTKT